MLFNLTTLPRKRLSSPQDRFSAVAAEKARRYQFTSMRRWATLNKTVRSPAERLFETITKGVSLGRQS